MQHLFAIRLPERDRVAELLARRGVQTGVHYSRAVHQHDAWSAQPVRHGELPVAEMWAAEELSLPMHPDLEPHEIEHVADALDAVRSTMGA